jgi:hypothetical protein
MSHPVALTLFEDAVKALDEAARWNDVIFEEFDVDRFLYSVRPYCKSYRVGRTEYRGANAGDFSGINEVDLLTGLCKANDPYYVQIIVDKMPFMRPEDQASLRDCMRWRDFLCLFIEALPETDSAPWFQENARAFVVVCEAHGRFAMQHHDMLVSRFIEKPRTGLDQGMLSQITASGPPLPVLLRSLEVLRNLRQAKPRMDVRTRHDELARLKSAPHGLRSTT